MATSVSALLPSFNEADRIAEALRAVQSIEGIDEIVCINDGSTDGTSDVASRIDGVRVIRLEQNQGKGAALNRGFNEVSGDIILILDADLGATAHEAAPLLTPVLNDEAEMTIAVLPSAKRGGTGMVMRAARVGVFRATGRWFPAPLSGQRAIRRWVLDRITSLRGKPFEERYGVETALDIDACLVGARIVEVPLPLDHREHGKTAVGFAHRARQLRDIYDALRARM